jgi:hypothetical protein
MKIWERRRIAQTLFHTVSWMISRNTVKLWHLRPELWVQSRFLYCIATGDESWEFQYDRETKLRSMNWGKELSMIPKKRLLAKAEDQKECVPQSFTNVTWSTEKLHLKGKERIFWFLPKGNGKVIENNFGSEAAISRKDRWRSLNENEPTHSVTIVKRLLANHGLLIRTHLAYLS